MIDILSEEMEGNVYEHISARHVQIFDEMTIYIDYYTVKQGEVLIIEKDGNNNDVLRKSHDSLQELHLTSKNLGKYTPNTVKPKLIRMANEDFKTKIGI